MKSASVRRLIVGISGASGAPIALELLRQLRELADPPEIHLVATKGGLMTLRQECGLAPEVLSGLADVIYDNENIGAAIASGSFRTMGMIVVPCSMKTISGIVSGYSDNLLLRAGDVCLKERRRLVLVARESPLSTVHLRNMYEASQLGAVILPPVLTYYSGASTLEECTCHVASRIMSQFGLGEEEYEWQGMNL